MSACMSYCSADLFGASEHGGGAGGAAVPGSEAGGRSPQALNGVKQIKTQHWETVVADEQHGRKNIGEKRQAWHTDCRLEPMRE